MMSKEAMKLALEALEGLEALLLSMGLTHLIVYGDAEKAITNLQKALANEALDKMAENARELGLDYEPAQEPVDLEAVYETIIRWDIAGKRSRRELARRIVALYTRPQAREPLSREEIGKVLDAAGVTELPNGYGPVELEIVRAIEAAHGIGEKK